MLKKKIIGVFLIMVFMIPVMPVMQVGCLLGSNLLTEEIAHQVGDSPVKQAEKENHSFIFNLSHLAASSSVDLKLIMDESVDSRQADDVQTPPPNM